MYSMRIGLDKAFDVVAEEMKQERSRRGAPENPIFLMCLFDLLLVLG